MKKVNNFKDIKKLIKKDDYNRPNDFGVEGVDHINVSLHSKSRLGKFLDPGYASFFEYPGLGKFRTILNLIYWLRDPSHNDNLRVCKRNTINSMMGKHNFKPLDNHKAISLYATYIRLLAREELVEEIKNLPDNISVLSYRIHADSGLRITTGYAIITIPIISELIKAIKEDREPDFKRFLNIVSTKEVGFLPPNISFGPKVEEDKEEDKPKKKRRRRRRRKNKISTDGDVSLVVDGDLTVTSDSFKIKESDTVKETTDGFNIDNGTSVVNLSPEGISTERKQQVVEGIEFENK